MNLVNSVELFLFMVKKPIHHVVTWKNNNQLTQCGPFKIKLAYIHGRLRDSRLPMELWAPLKEKTDRYGGLYIYRDGLRILPYGDSDTDFLKIEKRRTLSASEYFSHIDVCLEQ